MKFILSVALIVAIVGFINAQSPPNFQVCTAYVNSTEAAFCAPHVSYTILNNTDYTTVNNAARTVYDYALARITNATDACRAAVAAYACHSKISRCSRTGLYVRVFQGTCNTVATACGISDFPQNFTVTGTLGCIANQLNSVEGQNAICIPSQQVAVGASCQNIFANDITTPSPVQYSVCPIVAACNVTATAPTCVRPNNVGDVCTSSAGCISNPLSGGVIGGVGSPLQCISGICTYSGKREKQACVSNGECLSNNCTAGTCRVSDLNGPCTTSLGCANFLYCDTRNSTCYSASQGGESCGFLQPNWDLVPCVSGFSCVRPNVNATTSTCVPLANLNQACSVASGVVQDAPACNPLSANGPVSCQDGVCALTYKTLGQACSASVQCDPRYTCNYFNSTSGVCAEPNTVACATTASNCNMFQRCNCGADVAQTGTCAVDTTNPRVACATQYLAVATCQQNKCAGAPFVAYEANTCVTSNCLTELNAYYCCAKNTVGANFVAPIGMPAEPCVTPTPTPGPTSPTGTGTPVPIQSSKRSSASTVAVNLIALILAVVAFL